MQHLRQLRHDDHSPRMMDAGGRDMQSRRKVRRRVLAVGLSVALATIALTSQASASSTPLIIKSDTTLAGDYNGQIVVAGQGVTLNCAGHTLNGDGGAVGINVVAEGVTVTNCHVQGFGVGIQTSAGSTRIVRNAVTQNDQGIRLAGASGDTVSDNRANLNRSWGIIAAEGTSGDTITRNVANRNGLIGIALNNAFENLVSGNVTNHNGETGLDSLFSARNQIRNNLASSNGNLGFAFLSASDNTIVGNAALDNGTPGNGTGFNFNNSSRNNVSNNVAFHNGGVGFFTFFVSELNVFTRNFGCFNFFVDALDTSTGAGNTWTNNFFCKSQGI